MKNKDIMNNFNALIDQNKQNDLLNNPKTTLTINEILLQNQKYNTWKNETDLKIEEEKKKNRKD